MRIVTAFELKRLPKDVDEAFAAPINGTVTQNGTSPNRLIVFGAETYPFGLLTMIVSLEAIFRSTFVTIRIHCSTSC